MTTAAYFFKTDCSALFFVSIALGHLYIAVKNGLLKINILDARTAHGTAAQVGQGGRGEDQCYKAEPRPQAGDYSIARIIFIPEFER